MQIVRAFLIDAFVDTEVLAVFDGNQGMTAVRTAEDIVFVIAIPVRGEAGSADGTEQLALASVVLIEIFHGSAAVRADRTLRDAAFSASFDGMDRLSVVLLIAFHEGFPVPVIVEVLEPRKDIRLELLIFRRPGIIKASLADCRIKGKHLDQEQIG